MSQQIKEQILKDLVLLPQEAEVFHAIDWENCPRHIAFIMDGNGRWAKALGKPRTYGHSAGVRTVHEMVEVCGKLPVRHVTFYAFSTENWKRSETEVRALMGLFSSSLRKYLDELETQGVKIDWIGDISAMGGQIEKEFTEARERTKHNSRIHMSLALNYSGRADIVNALRSLGTKLRNGEISPAEINEASIQSHLSTRNLPEPELLIRTSGEMRLSNFMLWECAYSELYFATVHWPDFCKVHLFEAILAYQKRQRRFGGE